MQISRDLELSSHCNLDMETRRSDTDGAQP